MLPFSTKPMRRKLAECETYGQFGMDTTMTRAP
jgi:hypothetical protein